MAQAQVAREAFAVASVLQKSRLLGRLTSLRATLNGLVKVGSTMTHGLTDDLLVPFENDKYLNRALDLAETNLESIHAHHGEYLSRSEEDCIGVLQEDYENFYEPHFKNPYIPMGSNGPWIVTTHGNVIHDNGGYGMLGLGHTPSEITPALHGHDCQANIMTASFEAKEFADLLRQELGHRNMTENPFPKFMCLNSGSEGVELALRVSDAYSKQVAPGKAKLIIAMEDSFHGRTTRAGSLSQSCWPKYQKNLGSWEQLPPVIHVPANDSDALREKFRELQGQDVHVEAVVMEPTQGEGAPGFNITREFYDTVRELSTDHNAVMVIDSVQAGFRTRGSLSIIDAAGFESAEPPDLEVWSKAINAGQFPLSIVGLHKRMVGVYPFGVYGNTMTSNPRAMKVGSAVLRTIGPEIRANIVQRGEEFKAMLHRVADYYPEAAENVTGSGLLLALHMRSNYPVCGPIELEQQIRRAGVGVIHGGENAIRFTPHFRITSEEIEMVEKVLHDVLSTATPKTEVQTEI